MLIPKLQRMYEKKYTSVFHVRDEELECVSQYFTEGHVTK